jgi:hypothetical protein
MHSSTFIYLVTLFPFLFCQLAEGFFNKARDCCEDLVLELFLYLCLCFLLQRRYPGPYVVHQRRYPGSYMS